MTASLINITHPLLVIHMFLRRNLLFAGTTKSVIVRQHWSQEPQGFDREATLKLPQVLDGKKLPLVVDLHGNGGQGNVRRLSFLGESAIVLAPNGYQRSWNVFNEKSKADDVSFILDLIKKVVEENPVVNRNDVTIMGASNGAAMIYRLLLETQRDRPFHRSHFLSTISNNGIRELPLV